jgi:hypothetical protein
MIRLEARGAPCEMKMIPSPAAFSRSNRENNVPTILASRTAVGSSRIRHLGIERNRLGNFDHLLLGDAEFADRAALIDRDREPAEQVAGTPPDSGTIDGADENSFEPVCCCAAGLGMSRSWRPDSCSRAGAE